MKKRAVFTILFFAASLMAGGAMAAESGQSSGAVGAEPSGMSGVSASQQVRSADDLQSFSVKDSQGEDIGQISQLLIDMESGRVGYAIIGAGGVLGVGENRYIVPFNALKSGAEENTLTLDVQKDQLREAPEGDMQQALDRETGREIHQFYGVSPYWEESGVQQPVMEQEPGMEQQQPRMEREDQLQRETGSGIDTGAGSGSGTGTGLGTGGTR